MLAPTSDQDLGLRHARDPVLAHCPKDSGTAFEEDLTAKSFWGRISIRGNDTGDLDTSLSRLIDQTKTAL